MVASGRMGDGLQPSPRDRIGPQELGKRGIAVLSVTESQHGGEVHLYHKIGRGFHAAGVRGSRPAVETFIRRIAGDVAGRSEDGVRLSEPRWNPGPVERAEKEKSGKPSHPRREFNVRS